MYLSCCKTLWLDETFSMICKLLETKINVIWDLLSLNLTCDTVEAFSLHFIEKKFFFSCFTYSCFIHVTLYLRVLSKITLRNHIEKKKGFMFCVQWFLRVYIYVSSNNIHLRSLRELKKFNKYNYRKNELIQKNPNFINEFYQTLSVFYLILLWRKLRTKKSYNFGHSVTQC